MGGCLALASHMCWGLQAAPRWHKRDRHGRGVGVGAEEEAVGQVRESFPGFQSPGQPWERLAALGTPCWSGSALKSLSRCRAEVNVCSWPLGDFPHLSGGLFICVSPSFQPKHLYLYLCDTSSCFYPPAPTFIHRPFFLRLARFISCM